MDRNTQTALKIALSLGISFLIGSGINIWLSQVTGNFLSPLEFLWSLGQMLAEAAVLYLFFSLIFALFNVINQSAKNSTFHPVIFRSPSSFWKWWLGSILFIPLWWGAHFGLFFAMTGISETLIQILIILAFVPVALTAIITLINLPGYIRYRFTKH